MAGKTLSGKPCPESRTAAPAAITGTATASSTTAANRMIISTRTISAPAPNPSQATTSTPPTIEPDAPIDVVDGRSTMASTVSTQPRRPSTSPDSPSVAHTTAITHANPAAPDLTPAHTPAPAARARISSRATRPAPTNTAAHGISSTTGIHPKSTPSPTPPTGVPNPSSWASRNAARSTARAPRTISGTAPESRLAHAPTTATILELDITTSPVADPTAPAVAPSTSPAPTPRTGPPHYQ